MGNQQQYQHLSHKNKLGYDNNGVYYIMPNKVQNPNLFLNIKRQNSNHHHFQQSKTSNMKYSHNKTKSNIHQNLFEQQKKLQFKEKHNNHCQQNIYVEDKGVKSAIKIKSQSNIKQKQQQNNNQTYNKKITKHQRNHSHNNKIHENIKQLSDNNHKNNKKEKPLKQISNNNKNPIKKYNYDKIFGKCNIDTKRAIGDSNISYKEALDNKRNNYENQQSQQTYRQIQKDSILSISTKKNIVSHCELIKPNRYNNDYQILNNKQKNKRKQIQQTRKRQYSVCQLPLQRNLNVISSKNNRFQIYQINNIDKFQDKDIINIQNKKDDSLTRSRTKTQNSINQVQNSRLKLKRLQQQIKYLKKQVFKQQHKEQYAKYHQNIKTKDFKQQQKVKLKQSVKERIKQLKNQNSNNIINHNNNIKKSIQCTQMRQQSKVIRKQLILQDIMSQQHKFKNLLSTFGAFDSLNKNQHQNKERFCFKNQHNKQISTEQQIRKIEIRFTSNNNIKPPIQQFLSTQPIYQEIMKSDHLTIIKKFQQQYNQQNKTILKNYNNNSYINQKNIQQSVVKSFRHNKSKAYFDINYIQQQLKQ